MSVGGARNTVETVGELDGHYDGVIGAARADTSPNMIGANVLRPEHTAKIKSYLARSETACDDAHQFRNPVIRDSNQIVPSQSFVLDETLL